MSHFFCKAYVVTGDLTLKKIGEAMIKNGGYAMEHPLTRNWWTVMNSLFIVEVWGFY